jgi:Domain of unknown function (DUF3883)
VSNPASARMKSRCGDADDSERMREVKTIGLGTFFPFYVTGNEFRYSEDIPQQYHLFRVFDFGRESRLCVLHDSLRELCHRDPELYRAVIGSPTGIP